MQQLPWVSNQFINIDIYTIHIGVLDICQEIGRYMVQL